MGSLVTKTGRNLCNRGKQHQGRMRAHTLWRRHRVNITWYPRIDRVLNAASYLRIQLKKGQGVNFKNILTCVARSYLSLARALTEAHTLGQSTCTFESKNELNSTNHFCHKIVPSLCFAKVLNFWASFKVWVILLPHEADGSPKTLSQTPPPDAHKLATGTMMQNEKQTVKQTSTPKRLYQELPLLLQWWNEPQNRKQTLEADNKDDDQPAQKPTCACVNSEGMAAWTPFAGWQQNRIKSQQSEWPTIQAAMVEVGAAAPCRRLLQAAGCLSTTTSATHWRCSYFPIRVRAVGADGKGKERRKHIRELWCSFPSE